MASLATVIGFIAGALTTSCSLPQLIKALRTRKTRDISVWLYIMLTTGVALWSVYGLLLGEWPLILANGITVLLTGSILALKIKYG